MIPDPKNGRHLARSRSFEVKLVDKVPLTASNVPTKFRWNNQNTFGENYKHVISDLKKGRHFPRARLIEVKIYGHGAPYP